MKNNPLRSVSFENYKGFLEGTINIKPLTILLGANSVGKSSIIQLLLMLHQTAIVNEHRSVLKLNGSITSLGEHENIFHNKNTNNELKFSFKIKHRKLYDNFKSNYNKKIITDLLRSTDIFNKYIFESDKSLNLDPLVSIRDLREKYLKYFSKDSSISQKDFIKISSMLNMNYMKLHNEQEYIDRFRYKKSTRKPYRISKKEINKRYLKVYHTFNGAESIKSSIFDIEIYFILTKNKNKNILKVKKINLVNESQRIFSLEFYLTESEYTGLCLTSVHCQNNSILDKEQADEFLSKINQKGTIFTLFDNNDIKYELIESPIVGTIYDIFGDVFHELKKSFSRYSLNHIGPIRANPKRYYFLDRSSMTSLIDRLDEDTLTDILKEKSDIRNSVNKWLNKFDISISVSTLVDIIHKLRIKQNRLSLDITDVGFGISQVLPILVQCFLSEENSLTMIEQPEIHLHPTMQADLSDLFIDIIFDNKNKPSKYLLVETHSEYLLKRLRRRIAESKKIKSKHISINFISSKDNICKIEERYVAVKGHFEWPSNFYSGELLKDSVEFINMQ